MTSIILAVTSVVSLYFNFKYRKDIKQTILNHLNELEVYKGVIEKLEDKLNKATSVVSEDVASKKRSKK